jgi:phage-related protein
MGAKYTSTVPGPSLFRFIVSASETREVGVTVDHVVTQGASRASFVRHVACHIAVLCVMHARADKQDDRDTVSAKERISTVAERGGGQ